MSAAGHIKRNPESGEVAIRTIFGDETPQMAAMKWLVATTNFGSRYATDDGVADWDDLYTPEGS